MALRLLNPGGSHSRVGWIGAAAVFGFWAAIILSNQFHGRPPPSDRYYIAAFASSCVLSVVALALDYRRPHDQPPQRTGVAVG